MVELEQLLHSVGFRSSSDTLHAFIAHAQKSKFSIPKFIEQLVELETRERDARNLVARTRAATLGNFQTLDRFDWNHPRKIDRANFEKLHSSLSFINNAENILFRGPAGIGKTMLAQNLGLQALHQGYTVRFDTLAGVLADLLKQESIPALERRLKRYLQPQLLVLDELGYVPSDARAADLFFRIISERHEHRSVIITTNLAFKQWTTVFTEASCLGALIDRFAQHCHVFDIDAESWRDKHSLRREPAQKTRTSSQRSRKK
jgi:DNA replication protein DnaC